MTLTNTIAVLGCMLALVAGSAARAQVGSNPEAPDAQRLDDAALDEARGGLLTPSGFDVGFGASVRTYVDGSLALETRLTLTAEGPVSQRVFESAAATALTQQTPGAAASSPVTVAPGSTVIHDLAAGRIASVLMNTASDRSFRQETDVTFHLPQLPELQQQIATQRLGQALQAISPQAAGIGR